MPLKDNEIKAITNLVRSGNTDSACVLLATILAKSIPKKDQSDVAEIIDHLKTASYQGERSYFIRNKGGSVPAIISRLPLDASDRRVSGLLKKYISFIAQELGFKGGTYVKGGYRSLKNDPLSTVPAGMGTNLPASISFF